MIDTISITDLKQNASSVLKMVKDEGKTIMVLQRSKAAAMLVEPEYFSLLEKSLEDLEDLQAIKKRISEPTVSCEDVAKKFNSK